MTCALLVLAACALPAMAAPVGEQPAAGGPPVTELALHVSADGHYLEDAAGRPFFWLGDTAWLLTQKTSRADVEVYFAARARQGFTVIQAAFVTATEVLAGTLSPNVYGDQAFVGGGLRRPAVTPGESPQRAEEYDYWDHVDFIVERAGVHGLRLGMLPLFVGPDGYRYLTAETAFDYGVFLGRRYGAQPHLHWILGGDTIPDTPVRQHVWHEVARGITVGVAGTEDYGRTLMTFHPGSINSSSRWFHHAPWLDFNMAQVWGEESYIYPQILGDIALTPRKPTVLGEGSYEDGPQYPLGPITPAHVRRQAYWTYFAGGFHTYGNTNVWNFGTFRQEVTQDWIRALDSPGAQHLSVLARVFSGIRWWELEPDASLLTGGTGTRFLRNTAMRSSAGDLILVYLSSPATVQLRLGAMSGAGTVRAVWIDPQTGDRVALDASAASGSITIASPPQWPDALLLVEAAGGRG